MHIKTVTGPMSRWPTEVKVSLDPATVDALRSIAARENTTLTAIIRRAAQAKVARLNKKEKN